MGYLAALGIPTAVLAIMRGGWVYLTRKRNRDLASKFYSSRAGSWTRKALAYFLGKRMRRTWLLYYVLEQYISTLDARHEVLVIPGKSVELPIDRCFIPLELRAGQMSEAAQLLTKKGAVLLLGDPGAGKSAMLSWLIRTLCQNCREDRETARLPVYAPLQQLVPYLSAFRNKNLRPEQALQILDNWFSDHQLKPLNLYDPSNMLASYAQDGKSGIVILLDELDEIQSIDFPRMEKFILALTEYLSAAQGSNLIVIATRRQALDFTPRLLRGDIANLVAVELKPFSPAAIYSFLRRWPYKSPRQSAHEARRIFAQLRSNSTLMDTCSNPLALALYVDHDLKLRDLGWSNDILPPETRAAFYTDIVDYLMIRRRRDQLGMALPNRPFIQFRTNFFVAVADEHVKSSESFNYIAEDKLLKHIESVARSDQSPETALAELAKDTGIIARGQDGAWHFIHSSFLDYFLACSIATVSKKRDIEQIFKRLDDAPLRYLEGFYLACGLMGARNWPYLNTVLHDLSHNTFVGRYYPRAMLEAQQYFQANFVERMKFYCHLWKKDKKDVTLFQDLVAVLVEYERACHSMGRHPDVTVLEQFGKDDFAKEGISVLEAARLDIQLAMHIAQNDSMAAILTSSETEDAIVALYEPTIAEQLTESEIVSNRRLSAIVAETALRSSLVAASLVAPQQGSTGSVPVPRSRSFSHPGVRWADSWRIRNSRLSGSLDAGVQFVLSLQPYQRSEFPHIALLSYARPIRRLRNEVLFDDLRQPTFIIGASLLLFLPLLFLNLPGPELGLAAVGISLIVFSAFYLAIRTGLMKTSSARILNVDPFSANAGARSANYAKLVLGSPDTLPRWRLRRPKRSDGSVTAVYIREFPFFWRRFCPAMNDRRISRQAAHPCSSFGQKTSVG